MEYYLREWTPLTDLFAKLPVKAQSGIFNHDIKLTCVDILPEFIALGTNFGLVYWYDRKKKDLQRLRCENQNSDISTVKIISTVDYMVACGNVDGQISIFQIPKSHPECLPESLKPKSKQVERYTVADLHVSRITCLEWSKNGMKLFSGDKSGIVVLTEIDFYMHLCKSVEILNESYEIIQLSYFQQTLLVSTTYRSIICQKLDKWKICQVGKKDRKVLGQFGGIFHQTGLKSSDVLVYCTRPGLRIWVADITGSVQQTLLFKDIVTQESPEVPLINPISRNMKKLKPQKEASFGILLIFNEHLLVTFSNDVLYILDPTNFIVLATVSHCRRILDVAVHKDEIFILEGERSLIRISSRPEAFYTDIPQTQIPTASNFLPIANSIKGLTNKLQSSSIISAIPPLIEGTFSSDLKIETDSTSIINAEEALELPPVMKLDHDLPEITEYRSEKAESLRKLEIYEKIGTQDFDDTILYKHRRRKKHRNGTSMNTSATSISSNSSDEKDINISKPTLMNISTIGVLPDLRSPESILTDIENKEKLLAEVLNLNKVKLSTDTCTIHDQELKQTEEACKIVFSEVPLNVEPRMINEVKDEKQATTHLAGEIDEDVYHLDLFKNNYSKIMPDEASTKFLNYGPPSGSSNPNSMDIPACLSVPNMWNLQQITVNAENDTDNSLGEWEII